MFFLQKRFFVFLKISFLILFSFFIFLSFLVFWWLKDFPRPENFTEREIVQSTKIYDREGKVLLFEIFEEEKRSYVSLKEISDNVKKTIVFSEDKNFYSHFGVDFEGIVRAILIDLKIKKPVFGGSTIPQQLVRSAFLSTKKTLERKTKEAILAIQLNSKYSKDQILEWYLNQIPFGPNIYGVESASQKFFGQSAKNLNLAQAATLAVIVKAPSLFSPWSENGKKKEELIARKNALLQEMFKKGVITKDEFNEALKYKIEFLPPPKILAPHFTLEVKKYLEKKYGEKFLKEGGLKVFTTLDFSLQEKAEKIVKEMAEKNKKYGGFNASLVAIDPKTGEILALVGSKDFFSQPEPEGCKVGENCKFEPQFNAAFSSPGRQPGSAFKPFVYATAFKKGFDDKFEILDEPYCFGTWGGKEYCPQNYDGKFRGKVTLREGLAQSLNIPSVKVLVNLAGIEDSVKTAKDLGITTLKGPFGPSLVLGGWEVNLLEMVSAYGVFANDGMRVPYSFILKIEDAKGNILETNKKSEFVVLDKKVASLISDILADNEARAPVFGKRSPLFFEGRKVSVKTGTTDNFKDAWAIGYTKDLVVGVWVGNNDNSPMKKAPGVVVAAPIFHAFFEEFFSLKGF